MSYKKVNVLPRLKPPIVHGRIQPINESIISDKETTKKKKKKTLKWQGYILYNNSNHHAMARKSESSSSSANCSKASFTRDNSST